MYKWTQFNSPTRLQIRLSRNVAGKRQTRYFVRHHGVVRNMYFSCFSYYNSYQILAAGLFCVVRNKCVCSISYYITYQILAAGLFCVVRNKCVCSISYYISFRILGTGLFSVVRNKYVSSISYYISFQILPPGFFLGVGYNLLYHNNTVGKG